MYIGFILTLDTLRWIRVNQVGLLVYLYKADMWFQQLF